MSPMNVSRVCVSRPTRGTQGVCPEPGKPKAAETHRAQPRMATLAPLGQRDSLVDRPQQPGEGHQDTTHKRPSGQEQPKEGSPKPHHPTRPEAIRAHTEGGTLQSPHTCTGRSWAASKQKPWTRLHPAGQQPAEYLPQVRNRT